MASYMRMSSAWVYLWPYRWSEASVEDSEGWGSGRASPEPGVLGVGAARACMYAQVHAEGMGMRAGHSRACVGVHTSALGSAAITSPLVHHRLCEQGWKSCSASLTIASTDANPTSKATPPPSCKAPAASSPIQAAEGATAVYA